jgi:hypothetical protein
VPITIAQAYRRAVERAGNGHLLVQRAIRNAGHCTFSVAEQAQAFDDLVRWSMGGVRPDGDDLLADLRDIGRRFTTPLRSGDPGHAPDPAPPAPAAAAASTPAPVSRTYTATTAATRTATLTVTGTTLSVRFSPAVAGVVGLRLTNRTTGAVQTYMRQTTVTVPPGSYDVEVFARSRLVGLVLRDSATFRAVQVPPAGP